MDKIRAQLLRRPLMAASIGTGLLYLVIAQLWPQGVFWSPDSGLKYLQMASLRWDNGLRFDIPYPGQALDPDFSAVPLGPTFYEVREGHIYVVWPLLFPILSLAFYWLLGFSGLFLLPALTGAGTVYLTGRLAERLHPGTGLWAALLVGLATPVFFYSVMFWEHVPAVFCITLGAYLALTSDEGAPGWQPGVGGAAIALAGAMRAEMYVFAAALFIAIVALYPGRARWARAVPLGVGFAVVTIPAWATNYVMNGTPLPLNAAKNFLSFSLDYLSSAGIHAIVHFLVGDSAPLEIGGIFTVAAFAVIGAFAWGRGPGRGTLLNLALLVMVGSAWAIFVVSFPSQGIFLFHGFLAISPFLIFGLLPGPRAEDDAREAARRVLAVTSGLYAVLYLVFISLASPVGPSGGALEWGPRFFLGIYPLLTALAAAALPRLLRLPDMMAARRSARALFASLAITGVAFQMLGLWEIGRELGFNQDLTARVRAMPSEPIVSDIWWVPVTMPTLFFTRPMFDIYTPEVFHSWLRRAWRSGARTFRFASAIPDARNPVLRPPWPEGIRLRPGEVERAASGLWLIQIEIEADDKGAPHTP